MMSDIKISEMTEAEEVNDEDLIMIIQNGVNKKVKAEKVGTGGGGGHLDSLPIGSVIMWFSDVVPNGFLKVDGQAISRTEYSELFDICGTTYGEGDGSTTFNLPDMRECVPAGFDINSDTFNELGKKVGEKKHTMTLQELVRHRHKITVKNNNETGLYETKATNANGKDGDALTEEAGEGQPFNIIQPSICTNFIIKAKQEKTVQKDLTLSEVLEEVSNLVERGHNEKGYYEKYSDGTLKCWSSKEFGTVDINTAFGALFVSSALTLEDFPVSFADKPVLTKWLENGSSSSWLTNGLPYSTETNPRWSKFSSCCNRCSNKCKGYVYGSR